MAAIYELHYEKPNGDVIFCGTLSSEEEVLQEIRLLSVEFPEYDYWYDIVDDGDCCGYADVEVLDAIKEFKNADNAVLFDVVKIDYNDEGGDGERVVANFIFDLGEDIGMILGYDLSASSGSGWSYGAFCILKYGDEEVVSASW